MQTAHAPRLPVAYKTDLGTSGREFWLSAGEAYGLSHLAEANASGRDSTSERFSALPCCQGRLRRHAEEKERGGA
jgi:hypothetical protein